MEGSAPLWLWASRCPEKPFSWNKPPPPFLVSAPPGPCDDNDPHPRISFPGAFRNKVYRYGDLSLSSALFGFLWGDWLGRNDSAHFQAISSETKGAGQSMDRCSLLDSSLPHLFYRNFCNGDSESPLSVSIFLVGAPCVDPLFGMGDGRSRGKCVENHFYDPLVDPSPSLFFSLFLCLFLKAPSSLYLSPQYLLQKFGAQGRFIKN